MFAISSKYGRALCQGVSAGLSELRRKENLYRVVFNRMLIAAPKEKKHEWKAQITSRSYAGSGPAVMFRAVIRRATKSQRPRRRLLRSGGFVPFWGVLVGALATSGCALF